jgi:hypothetical protein
MESTKYIPLHHAERRAVVIMACFEGTLLLDLIPIA